MSKKELKLIATRGIPASGKSTWAKEQVANSNGSIVRVNKDDLRAMLHCGKFSKEREKQILDARNYLIVSHLKDGKSVIVDDTNFAQKHIDYFAETAKQYGAKFEIVDFHLCPREAIKRDAARPNPVGASVVMDMYLNYRKKYVNHVEKLPNAIICDLDGTLALKYAGRNYYDCKDCDKDTVNLPIYNILDTYNKLGTKLIFCSGREAMYEEPSRRFLDKLGFSDYTLLMRVTGDTRNDGIVKTELYQQYIEGKYNILFVLDDRDRVVYAWRKLGLPTLQVEFGDF